VLRPNNDWGFYLFYRRDTVPLGEVRQLVEATFGFDYPTVIIDDLAEERAGSLSLRGGT
jgi:hypothetical protein